VNPANQSSPLGVIMLFQFAADAVLLLHLSFILFVLLGAAITAWWHWIPIVHLPAVAWGIFVEITGRICPLTYLENYLRIKAGQSGYAESFIEHYLLAIIYPAALTQGFQFSLTGAVVIVNVVIYGWLLYSRHMADRTDA
jgi:hypothetical protein